MEAKAIGAVVRRLRKEAGLSQAELATTAGVCYAYVSMIERGERLPALDKLEALAKALRAPMAAFFNEASPLNVATTRYIPLLQFAMEYKLRHTQVNHLVKVGKTLFPRPVK